MDWIKVVLDKGGLLFILGIYWKDISQYIQIAIVHCNPNIFGLITAAIVYIVICKL